MVQGKRKTLSLSSMLSCWSVMVYSKYNGVSYGSAFHSWTLPLEYLWETLFLYSASLWVLITSNYTNLHFVQMHIPAFSSSFRLGPLLILYSVQLCRVCNMQLPTWRWFCYMTPCQINMFSCSTAFSSATYIYPPITELFCCVVQSIFHHVTHVFLILGVNITVNELTGYRDITNLKKNPIKLVSCFLQRC